MYPDLELPAEEDIDDRSKADLFTKAFASAQCLWLVIQSIARASAELPITQLELATMAFVACALLMYILWWNKPFGVERRVTLIDRAVTESHVAELDLRLASENGSARTQLAAHLRMRLFCGFLNHCPIREIVLDTLDIYITWVRKVLGGKPRHNCRRLRMAEITQRREVITGMTFYTACTLFSGFHIAAWNWEFPSSLIRITW
jgi:hypothetical protein